MATTKVFTVDSLVDEITPMVETMMKPWLENNPVNFASILMASMSIVEQFSSSIGKLSGSDKLKVAKLMIPKLIDYSVSQGKLTQEEGDDLKEKIATAGDTIDNIISIYAVISKNPEVINAIKEVGENIKGCLVACRRKK